MVVRIHEPGVFSTADVGRVYMIRYRILTTLATEHRIWDDYQAHCDHFAGRTPIVASSEQPLLPMPDVEVRAFWRQSLSQGHGVEAIAVIGRGLGGLAAAAMTNLLEHLVDPGLGTRYRVFAKPASAVAWLAAYELEATDAEVMAAIRTQTELP